MLTFHDIQAWQAVLEEAWMSGFGADCLFIEVFSVINCHVAPVDLLDLAASGGIFVLHRYYGREVFYYVARGKCQEERVCMDRPGQPRGLPLRDNVPLGAAADLQDAWAKQSKDTAVTNAVCRGSAVPV